MHKVHVCIYRSDFVGVTCIGDWHCFIAVNVHTAFTTLLSSCWVLQQNWFCCRYKADSSLYSCSLNRSLKKLILSLESWLLSFQLQFKHVAAKLVLSLSWLLSLQLQFKHVAAKLILSLRNWPSPLFTATVLHMSLQSWFCRYKAESCPSSCNLNMSLQSWFCRYKADSSLCSCNLNTSLQSWYCRYEIDSCLYNRNVKQDAAKRK